MCFRLLPPSTSVHRLVRHDRTSRGGEIWASTVKLVQRLVYTCVYTPSLPIHLPSCCNLVSTQPTPYYSISKTALSLLSKNLQMTQLTRCPSPYLGLVLAAATFDLSLSLRSDWETTLPPGPRLTSLATHAQCRLSVCFPVSSPWKLMFLRILFLAIFSL